MTYPVNIQCYKKEIPRKRERWQQQRTASMKAFKDKHICMVIRAKKENEELTEIWNNIVQLKNYYIFALKKMKLNKRKERWVIKPDETANVQDTVEPQTTSLSP